jgi:hypothetical protein
MFTVGRSEILDGFRLGYHGGWDETDLSANEVVIIEREASATQRQLQAAARKRLLDTLVAPDAERPSGP